jgi:peptidoglycan/LPS O-acetylase OafA/YrhL
MHPPNLANANTGKPEMHHDFALDGIRGLAILMVLGRHLIVINNSINTPLYVFARGFRDSLFSGVDVFFALSGFLITRILVKTVADSHYFRSFYARRALRIFPLYYGVLLLLFAITPLYHIHWGGQQWRLLTYSNRLFQSSSGPDWHFYFGGFISLVNFWSLHIEEQFYFLWPLCVFFIRSPRRLFLFALGISLGSLGLRFWLLLHGYSQAFVYTALITRFDSLLIGAALAIALRTRLHTAALKIATPLFLTATALFIVVFALDHRSPSGPLTLLFALRFTLLALASTGLIAMCLKPRSRTAHTFRNPVMRFFGKYSYGIYVYHSILPMFYIQRLSEFTSVRIPIHFIGNLLNSAVEFAVTVAVAMLSYHFFEQPILHLKRFFPSQPSTTTPDTPFELEVKSDTPRLRRT